MANTYFVVFAEQEDSGSQELGRKAGKEGKTLEPLKSAKFVKLEAESVADAQASVKTLYPGVGGATTPVVVAEAAWKTS